MSADVETAFSPDLIDAQMQLRRAFDDYEAALMINDVDVMNGYFWASPDVVRFGVADGQWGAEQVRRWRAGAAPVPSGRTLLRTRISLLNPQVGIVTTLFTYPGRGGHGRQSQTWFRFPHGWQIVNAHVSEIAADPPPEPLENAHP